MSDWTSGYVADVGYTYGYYLELNPLRIRLAFLNAGLAPPKEGACCELGFGQGISINIHAAASEADWWGTDFNPSQARFARELAEASDSGAKLFDESFAEFCARDDLPEFVFIGLHGIWSWISNENRGVIVDFIRRKLKAGGVLYISYNTMPGWAAFAPLRDLMVEHAEVMAAPGRGIISRIDAAVEFAERLLSINPGYGRANPQMVERLKTLKPQNRYYLAHEYFNRDWHPMSFAKVAEWLEPAKIRYACSAHYLDLVDTVNLTEEQRTFLKGIPDVLFRETVRDFLVNQQFRRDYWVRGARRLTVLEHVEALRQTSVVLGVPRTDITLKTRGALGEITMQPRMYEPVLDALSDYCPKTVSQIEAAIKPGTMSLAQIAEVLTVLSGSGQVLIAQADAMVDKVRKRIAGINRYLAEKARSGDEITFLASALTGGAIPASRMTQLFLLSTSRGQCTADGMASFVWQLLSAQGQLMLKDGKPLESEQENLSELKLQAEAFIAKQLPTLRALAVELAP